MAHRDSAMKPPRMNSTLLRRDQNQPMQFWTSLLHFIILLFLVSIGKIGVVYYFQAGQTMQYHNDLSISHCDM